MQQQVCLQPFTALEIDVKGDVYTCCPAYINNFKIGNIYENNAIEDIWYSKRATVLRERILNNDFSICNLDLCRQQQFANEQLTTHPPLPRYVTLAYDKECNLKCLTCRDEKYKNSEEQENLFNEKIETVLLPLLKNAQILALSGAGEAFYSSHSRLLIKKIATENKQIKFNINTNGILFNFENCKSLGLLNRINEVFISLPAIRKNTYNKIMRGSNLDVVLKNLEWMSKAQKANQINKITINMVISSLNYKEIPSVVGLAKKLDIHITISQYCYWGTEFGKDFDNVAVWKSEHKDYIKFIKTLKRINYDKCFLSPLFKNLQETKISFIDQILNW